MEAGNGTAGHGNEQDGEHGAQLLIGETGENGQVHGGVCDQQADHSTCDHGHEHEGGHVVTGLLQQPHGQHGSEEDVNEGDVAPCSLAQDDRSVCANHEGQHDEHDADDVFLPAGEVELVLQQAKDHSEHHEHDGDHAGSAVGLSSFHQSTVGAVGVEGACDHVCEGSDDDAAEQPAEQQEQLAAGLADILLDQHAHALAVILDGSVQSAEVGDGTEEDAAQQDPQQNGQPAESGSLDGTGDRACTGNGAELVGEHRPTVGGNIVPAILMDNSRGLGGGVDAPLICQPAAVECVSTEQTHGGDQYDDQRIHCFYLFPFFHAANRPGAQHRPADEAGPQSVKKPSSIRKIFLGRKIVPEDEGSHIHCTMWMICSAVPLRLLSVDSHSHAWHICHAAR